MSQKNANGGKRIRAPRGTEDTMPEDMPMIGMLESAAKRVFELYGYGEIRTPMFEYTNLFVRSIGEATDIVEKEMYTFAGSGDESFTLRPEGTAPVARAFVEHGLDGPGGFHKFFYIGPMFRRERPQAGRMREFYQIGAEAIGSADPCVDAETIEMAMKILSESGLGDCDLKINSIGCPECRAVYRSTLREALEPRKNELCEDCRRRIDRNVFRVLDCKNEKCREISAEMPAMREHLDENCAAHFNATLELLKNAGVDYNIDDMLVRGFDYYTRTVWEIAHSSLGARDAICGGGRYDNLVEEVGGKPSPAAGFSIGVVPTLIAMNNKKVEPPEQPAPRIYLVAIDDSCRAECFRLAIELRSNGLPAELDYQGRSAKAQMRSANKSGAAFAGIIGPDELADGEILVKNMETGEERKVALGELERSLVCQRG